MVEGGDKMDPWTRAAAAQELMRRSAVPSVIHVWPEVFQAFQLFCAVLTQWRYAPYGMGGAAPTGLDYQGVRASPAFRAIPREQRESVFADVCVMEREYVKCRCAALKESEPSAEPDDDE